MNKLTNGKALRPPAPADYETDFVLWSERQAQLLRSQKFDQLDLPNLLEELDAMGASQRKELRSRLVVLLMHLLKCRYQPERKSASWIATLGEQRTQILLSLEQSPSLGKDLEVTASAVYHLALKRAAQETMLPVATFPPANPFSEQDLLDLGFIP